MKIPVHNSSAMPIYVGTAMILPGETRHFDEADVPMHLRPAPAAPEPVVDDHTAQLAALIEGSVRDVIEQISGLSDSDLASLIEMEEAGHARKTLLAALNDELSDRALDAAATLLLEGSEEEVLEKITAASDAELDRAAEVEAIGASRESVLAAIAAEQLKRKS